MKRKLFMCLLLLVLAGTALGIDYVYYGTVDLPNPTKTLGGVALKADGDLYYVTFADITSNLVYVDNAIPGVKTKTYAATYISTETAIVTVSRGLNDIELDSSGNIYISGTGDGGLNNTILKKFSAAPAHAVLWSMPLDANNVRHNGIELMSDTVLAIGTTWNKIGWKKTSDGTAEGTGDITGGDNYGRSIALNTTNNDIYMGRNGNSVLSALKVFSGGSPSNLAGYSLALDNLLAPLGNGTATASAMQPIDYDPNNNQLLAADCFDQNLGDTVQGLRIYSIAGTGASTIFTQLQFFDGSTIPGRIAQYYNVYGISYNKIGGKDYIALAVNCGGTPATFAIDILMRPGTGFGDWDLY